jgi:hypothetical protein
MGRTATAVGVLVAIGLALGVVVGCGGSSGSKESTTSSTTVSPSAFADGLCSAVQTYEKAVKSAAQKLTGGNLSKDSLQSAAGDVETATQQFVSDVKGLGTPQTAGGTQAKQAVDQLAKALQEDVTVIKSAIKGISGVSGIPGALSTIAATASSAKTQVTSAVTDLQNLPKGELKTAFQNSSACKSVASSV